MTLNKQDWAAPQNKGINSIDMSSIVFKPTIKDNPYLRTPTYRKRVSIPIKGTNSECY